MRLFAVVWLLATAFADATFRSRDALRDAVDLWTTNETLARETYGDIKHWSVARVENMNLLFNDKFDFNSDISAWDVSKVTSMNHMFDNSRSFSVDISGWDVSRCQEMYAMFNGAAAFDNDLSRWDISQVRLGSAPMRHMFRGALSLGECHKYKINAAWAAANDKWHYASAWGVGELSEGSCAPSPPSPSA